VSTTAKFVLELDMAKLERGVVTDWAALTVSTKLLNSDSPPPPPPDMFFFFPPAAPPAAASPVARLQYS